MDPLANPFAVLGLPADPDLTDEDIHAAWRVLLLKAHPDRGGDDEYAALVTAAYRLLRNGVRRAETLELLDAHCRCRDLPRRDRPPRPRAADPATTGDDVEAMNEAYRNDPAKPANELFESDPAADRQNPDRDRSTDPAIAAAVITDRGRVLLVRRRIPEGDLVWQFPAGKVEPGETVGQAAVREAAEETGFDVVAVSALGRRIHPSTGRTISYVACELDTTPAESRRAVEREVAELAWCTRAQLDELVPHRLHRPVRLYLDAVLDVMLDVMLGDSETEGSTSPKWIERVWLEVVGVAELPSPARWQPFDKHETCMRWRWPGYRRWRQLRPRRGGRGCCWFHGGDWHTVCETVIRHLEQLRDARVNDVDEQRHEILRRSAADRLTEWEQAALEVFMHDEIAVLEVEDREPGDNPYINGRHRIQAMIDAGVRRALIVRREITWPNA